MLQTLMINGDPGHNYQPHSSRPSVNQKKLKELKMVSMDMQARDLLSSASGHKERDKVMQFTTGASKYLQSSDAARGSWQFGP